MKTYMYKIGVIWAVVGLCIIGTVDVGWAFCWIRDTGYQACAGGGEQQTCCDGHLRKWDSGAMTYQISNSTDNGLVANIQTGMSQWNQIPMSIFTFAAGARTAEWGLQQEGVNVVNIDNEFCTHNPALCGIGILGMSGCFENGAGTANYRSTECDVILNGTEFTWGDGTGGTRNTTAVIAHEAGHDAGLSHPGSTCRPGPSCGCGPEVPEATMYWTYSGGQPTNKASLELDDAAALVFGYPVSTLRVRVLDGQGNPVQGAEVELIGTAAPVNGANIAQGGTVHGDIDASLIGDQAASATYVADSPFDLTDVDGYTNYINPLVDSFQVRVTYPGVTITEAIKAKPGISTVTIPSAAVPGWAELQKLLASDGTEYDWFGGTVAISGDYAIVGAPEADDSFGSAYIFVRSGNGWTQQVQLTAADGALSDAFGFSVAISGDSAIVGADGDDDLDVASGSAYIFMRNGNSWSQQAKLTAADGANGDRFGGFVAISGDYAIVGAYQNDDLGYDSGSAYIFVRTGDTWTQQTKLTAADGTENDNFGASVAISGDYAIVGTYGNDHPDNPTDSAYIFVRSGDTWIQQAKLTATDGIIGDGFGGPVSISGDSAIVGTWGGDYTDDLSGSAYIFVRSGDTWTQQAKLTTTDGAEGDLFGNSVAIFGNSAIVGAGGHDDALGVLPGSAYLFGRNDGIWEQQAKLIASDGAAADQFGGSVAIYRDSILVGTNGDDDLGASSGSAYAFQRKKPWTFLVYMNGDNDLESFAIEDFLEMAQVGSNADVNIVVQFDRVTFAVLNALGLGAYDSTAYGDWDGTKRFYVTQGMTPVSADALEDVGLLGEANMGNPTTLQEFIDWGVQRYPAENYALVVWDHGQGWRKRQEMLLQALEMAAASGEYAKIQRLLKQLSVPYKSVSEDYTAADRLYMNEVQTALNAAQQDLNLLGFDACLMSMVEVAYEVKDTGPAIMVGSEELEPGDGWPYDLILADLATHPLWTPAQLGTAIVDHYYASYGNSETQAATELAQVAPLAAAVDALAQTLRASWNDEPADVKAAAQTVIDQVNAAVIHEQHGAAWPGAHGLAIYFPLTLAEFDPDYHGGTIDFPADTAWEEFLADYYATRGGSWVAAARAQSQTFNDVRPGGFARRHIDLYDFCEKLIASAEPEIEVQQNQTPLPNGSGSFDFGETAINETTGVVFDLSNWGTADLLLTGAQSVTISGPEAADFSVTHQPVSPVAPGGGTTFTLRFAPTVAGVRTATVTIASNDANENPYTFTVTGTGTEPEGAQYLLWTK